MGAAATIAALAMVVLAASSVRGTIVVSNYCHDNDVTVDGYYCATCLDVVYCSAGVTYHLEDCLNEVCDGDLTYSSCVPMEEARQCQCGSATHLCDSYNPEYVIKCNDNGMYDVLACDGDETCDGGKCGPVVPGVDSCDDDGAVISDWNFITPDCTKGFYCYADGRPEYCVQCEANHYIDANGDCLPSPPLPCASGCTGVCPDNLDCTHYYHCNGSGTVTDDTQCPEGTFFNPNAVPVPMCQEDDSLCAPLTFCDFDDIDTEITTTTTTTSATTTPTTTTTTTATPTTTTTTASPLPTCSADNVGNYPSGPCSSSYWSCVNTGGGNYEYISQECRNGQIFNTDPSIPYCDLAENVDTCDVRDDA